jgi:hypothetical protein
MREEIVAVRNQESRLKIVPIMTTLLAATSLMLCLFLDQNKYYRPDDGFPASMFNFHNTACKREHTMSIEQ